MSTHRTLVVVPAFNEENTVALVVDRASALGLPVCVVNDGSRDATETKAREQGAVVLSLPVNLGVGGALRCGFRYALRAGYDTVVQVDGDGQHNPSEIPGMLSTMDRTGADMVVGSRFLASDSAYIVTRARRLMMRLLARRASVAVGTRITDATSGFRAIRSPLLDHFADEFPVEYLGDTFEALVAAGRRGARVVEQPIEATHRQHGAPSASTRASVWYITRALIASAIVYPQPRRGRDGPTIPSTADGGPANSEKT